MQSSLQNHNRNQSQALSNAPSGDLPVVSIGIPIYNEERFLEETLLSLRNQDYPNLEIVISDNASIDGTAGICRRHAAEDSRIRVETSQTNRGATANFQRVLDLAQGEYFMWASGHDLWSPNLITECVRLLEANTDACIAFGSSNWIDADGQPLKLAYGWTDTRGLSDIARFFSVFWGNMHPILGVIRLSTLRDSGDMPAIVGGDLVLLARLSLKGHFLHARHASWSRREFRNEASYSDKLKRYKSSNVGLAKTSFQKRFPLLALPVALTRTVLQSNIRTLDKLVMLATLAPSLVLRYMVGRRGLQ